MIAAWLWERIDTQGLLEEHAQSPAAEMSRNSSSDPQGRVTDECNLENSKLWTGGILTSETGKGSSSYALPSNNGALVAFTSAGAVYAAVVVY